MSCNCLLPDAANNWRELASATPRNPLDIIANATLNGNSGVFLNSTSFATPPSVWHAAGSPVSLTANPTDAALGSDQQLNVANANQWQFKNPTWNSDTKLAPPLRKLIYLRGGNQWAMSIRWSVVKEPKLKYPRNYHSNAILLYDGRVLICGSNVDALADTDKTVDIRNRIMAFEIYTPEYLLIGP